MRCLTMAMKNLPDHLKAAYDWTAAAGQIEELRKMGADEAATYCRESAENSVENGDGDVSESDLTELHAWLQAK